MVPVIPVAILSMPFSLKKANVYVVSGTGCNVTVVEPASLCTNICVGLPCVVLLGVCCLLIVVVVMVVVVVVMVRC